MESEADQLSCRRANYAQALNNVGKHEDVIRLWEDSRAPGAVNEGLAIEYLQAMVKTGRIKDFAPNSK